jgi:hypothetical protein
MFFSPAFMLIAESDKVENVPHRDRRNDLPVGASSQFIYVTARKSCQYDAPSFGWFQMNQEI